MATCPVIGRTLSFKPAEHLSCNLQLPFRQAPVRPDEGAAGYALESAPGPSLQARSTKTDPTEYPAPNEQISPVSPGAISSEYFENAMIDPAEDVFA